MEAVNANQPHEVELSKGPNFKDSLTLEKPDENVCGHENSSEQFPRYEQLVFNFFMQHPRVLQPQSVNEEVCAGGRPQSGISHYEQLELFFRRPLPKKEDIILIELIDTAKNGRPSQRAEARHELRQIFKQNPNHRLRVEMEEALKGGNRPGSHLLTRAKDGPDEKGEIFEIVSSKLRDFAELLKQKNEIVWTEIVELLSKLPGLFSDCMKTFEKNGRDIVEKVQKMIDNKAVKVTTNILLIPKGVIVYLARVAGLAVGFFFLAAVTNFVDNLSKGQISQTGKYSPAFSEWA